MRRGACPSRPSRTRPSADRRSSPPTRPRAGGWTVGVAAEARELGLGPGALLLTSILAAFASNRQPPLVLFQQPRAREKSARTGIDRPRTFSPASRSAQRLRALREFDSLANALARASELLSLRTEQQRRTEQELRASEEHFRLLRGQLAAAGLDGGSRWPHRLHQLRAAKDMDAIGRTDWEGIIHPDDRRATAEAWLRASEAGVPYEMEHRLFAIGKGYAWHLSRASPLLDAQGRVVRWYGTTTDIDDQKQREENIRDLMAEVNHRSRNLLAVAQAIARCGVSTAKTIHEFEQRYSDRLVGLAASQDLLTDRNWRGVPLEALVRAQVVLPSDGREKRLRPARDRRSC